MGIQSNINQLLGTAATAMSIGKVVEGQKKQTEATNKQTQSIVDLYKQSGEKPTKLPENVAGEDLEKVSTNPNEVSPVKKKVDFESQSYKPTDLNVKQQEAMEKAKKFLEAKWRNNQTPGQMVQSWVKGMEGERTQQLLDAGIRNAQARRNEADPYSGSNLLKRGVENAKINRGLED